jgi:hypothetical protein
MKKTVMLLITLIPLCCFAQKGTYMSVNTSVGYTGYWFDDSFTEMGVDVENQFSKHSGVGVGVSLARYYEDTYLASIDYIRLPIYYTLHTKLVDISPVVQLSILQNRTFTPGMVSYNVVSYYPNFFVDYGLRLSKDFQLRKNLYLVAKAQASFDPINVYNLFSIGLGLKRRFN